MLLRTLLPLAAMAVATSVEPVSAPVSAPRPATVAAPSTAPVRFAIDKAHSEIMFKVTHLGFSTVSGQFTDFDGSFQLDPQTKAASAVNFTIKTASINTRNERRDAHLKSADFFEAEKFPEITFASTSVTKGAGDTYTIVGNLSMHGVTRPVTLNATLGGVRPTPAQGERPAGFIAGATATGTLKRSDFGLVWNRMAEGVAVVSDDIRMEFSLEARGN
jgi:polyisoprenoid-binding protein YceI